MGAVAERGLWLPGAADRTDLSTFADRALRLDDAAVVRLRSRDDEMITAWVATGFDVLVCRSVRGRAKPEDLTMGADVLLRGLTTADDAGFVDPGYAMDSAWRGALPPTAGFSHLDDVPGDVMADLAQRGAELAREHSGGQGPPVSLLDQDVLSVSAGGRTVGIPMRCVFALSAMGFLPTSGDAPARVRVSPTWLRVDARYGSVYRRRGQTLGLS